MKTIEVCEDFREYFWTDGFSISIKNVEKVHITETGSHRVTDINGVTTYIPSDYKYFKFKGDVVA